MRVPLRVAIVTLVVGLLVATAGPLTLYGVRESFDDIALLRREYLEQTTQLAAEEVSRLPRLAERVLKSQRSIAEQDKLPIADSLALARVFAAALAEFSELTWLSYAEQTSGRFVGATRTRPDQIVLNISDPAVGGGVPRELQVATDGKLEPFVRTPPITRAHDPRARPWYRAALAAPQTVVWMPPHASGSGDKSMTAALAVRAPGGDIHGVLTADFSLVGLDEVLRARGVARRGTVGLTTSTGEILAGGAGPERDVLEEVIRGDRWRADIAARAPVRSALAHVDGSMHDVAITPLAAASGLDWAVAVVVPDDDFMAPVSRYRRHTVVIAALGLVLAAVLGTLIATRIARSLGAVAAALDRMAQFDVATAGGPPSRLKEIAAVQHATERMRAGLQSFARYAPEEIIREAIVDGREAVLCGDKREVSVLFGKLRGFTALAEGMAPEQVVAVLNDHLGALSALVTEHGGYVVDLLADRIFAVFGAPRACPDHAARAVACAIRMQRIRQTQNAENLDRGWPPLEMAVGITTGPAVVGNMGSRLRVTYGVVGHPVNVAARLESRAVAGQVLVSDTTRRALADQLVVDGPFEGDGKGVGAPILMWAVQTLKGHASLELPEDAQEITSLVRPLDARLRLIGQTQLDAEVHAARILALGAVSAEVVSNAATTLLGAVQVLFSWDDGGPAILAGKVVSVAEWPPVGRTSIVRFEGLGWDARGRLEALKAAHASAR